MAIRKNPVHGLCKEWGIVCLRRFPLFPRIEVYMGIYGNPKPTEPGTMFARVGRAINPRRSVDVGFH
jgi:hypothetical protein